MGVIKNVYKITVKMNTEQKNILILWVKEAGNQIRKHRHKITVESMSKVSSYDYGIPADKESEKIIFQAIKETGLDCTIICEESERIGNENAKYTIYLDPLDGSVNFSRGIPAFCIGIAVYKNNTPLLGIIYDISMDELFVAEAGQGVSVNGNKITPVHFEANLLINLEWFWAERYEEIVTKLKHQKIRARTSGSGVLALCYGCIWRGDGAILIGNGPWDIAPWLVFAQENWFEAKQSNGKDIDLSLRRQDIIVAPKEIFEKLMSAINQNMKDIE